MPQPARSPIVPQMLRSDVHAEQIRESLARARALGLEQLSGPVPITPAADVFSLAPFQSGFRDQGDRGACWAFAGAAALEAAYRRQFGLQIKASEEYIFHMGKAFALNRTAVGGPVVLPVENNTTLTGFQGSADITQKLSENAAPPLAFAPYIESQGALLGILPALGFANQAAVQSQEDFDAVEFCEQHVPLLARVNARYRASGFASLGGSPSIQAIENTLLANHEVVCDVQHLTAPVGGHVLVIVGYDRTRRRFQVKNSWGENAFIEIAYENDPNWQILSGWYLTGVVDQTFVQNQACWLGNWWLTVGGQTSRLLLRRSEDFAAPGQATRLGSMYLGDGRHDVNGQFVGNGSAIRLFVAPNTAPTMPGTSTGLRVDASLDFADIYNASGSAGNGQPVSLTRFATRFAALFEAADNDPVAWQARHGIDATTYQQTFDALVNQGFRLVSVNGYSEGIGSRFNAVWHQRPGPAWQARHGLTSQQYQATFDTLVAQGFRLTCVSGYAEHGQARYAGIWEQRPGPAWQARHGLTAAQYQQAFTELAAQGFVPILVNAYRVNVDVLFAALWELRTGVGFEGRHGLTSSEYQKAFDANVAAGRRLVWVSGYSDTGIARYAAIWHSGGSGPWQARHGLSAQGYQQHFNDLAGGGFRPGQVSGYGDGFYPA